MRAFQLSTLLSRCWTIVLLPAGVWQGRQGQTDLDFILIQAEQFIQRPHTSLNRPLNVRLPGACTYSYSEAAKRSPS